MATGRFITFEGIEGSGKSTQIQLLAEHLERQGCEVRILREPGGTAVGDRIRAILLDSSLDSLCDVSEMLLFAASRAQLVREAVRPALDAGKTVLCDRFVHSSLAYQGHARELGRERVYAANREALDGVLPEVVVLLDIDPDEALGRARARSDLDRIEAEDMAFHARVRAGFLAEAQADPERFVLVSASGDPQAIHQRVVAALEATP